VDLVCYKSKIAVRKIKTYFFSNNFHEKTLFLSKSRKKRAFISVSCLINAKFNDQITFRAWWVIAIKNAYTITNGKSLNKTGETDKLTNVTMLGKTTIKVLINKFYSTLCPAKF
jgi:hypothetical protein